MIRTLIAALTALVLTTLPAAAQKLSLGEVSQYLNSIQSAKGQFTQINGDGSISTGTISIKRPGKVRFEYNPPDQALVLAWAGAVYVFDKKLGGQPETYPLSQTPLSIILDRNVNLGRAGMVTGHGYDGTATTVTAQDPQHPDRGSIQMKFTANPVQLRQWVITDGNGAKTTVVLGALSNAQLPNSVFDVNRVK
ncbi:cell envelope biogenesis protein LolA [Alloyangia pacifica]|uniref:Cell envelope biogenesis protein LolA n=1 Tax=Alloyangia pacifica TaxID=311180 RepID=A0A2U8HF73_9RHOB|nr:MULTISPECIES: outer membrane lipoprotein carrier protein LolA [Roseobacteraceae]AWI84462.1 cell envelope biogenesis protein LolA [Alloyangia pacifica]NDV54058.1 outer membrane lipoprotein carrier protein LolA [Salipiger sp. PrR003]NDW32230.1 outer membrane lipoprotein carrier protein LolA [Salipiger sp. PrR007]